MLACFSASHACVLTRDATLLSDEAGQTDVIEELQLGNGDVEHEPAGADHLPVVERRALVVLKHH